MKGLMMKQKKEQRSWQGMAIHKVMSNGHTIEWTIDRKDAEAAYKDAGGVKSWVLVNPDGTVRAMA